MERDLWGPAIRAAPNRLEIVPTRTKGIKTTPQAVPTAVLTPSARYGGGDSSAPETRSVFVPPETLAARGPRTLSGETTEQSAKTGVLRIRKVSNINARA